MNKRGQTRVAIIGTGMIGSVHRKAARNAGANVIGVLGSTAMKSEAAAKEWNVPKGYANLKELLNDKPDFVQICAPNATHFEYALRVIQAEINVVCEKPLATSKKHADLLVKAAREAGIVATVPFVYRYHPLVREIRSRRIAGEFGRVLLVHGSYLQDWLLNQQSTSWRVDSKLGGASRAFADIGSHWCDLASFISGDEFSEVLSTTTIAYASRPVPSGSSFDGSLNEFANHFEVATEDTAVVSLKSQKGILFNTVISQVSAGRKNRLWIELDGSKQSAVFDQENPDSIWLGSEVGAKVLRRGEGTISDDQARLLSAPPGHPQGYQEAFTSFLDDRYALGRGEHREGVPSFTDGARSAALVEAVLESAEKNSWVRIQLDVETT